MKILKFPNLRQTYNYDCWASALQSIMTYYWVEKREEKIIKKAKTVKKIWTDIKWLIKVLKKYNFEYDSKKMNIEDIINYIDKKIPVIVLLQAWSDKKNFNYENSYKNWHYVVAIWYDKNKLYFEDPCSFNITYINKNELEKRWHWIEKTKKIPNHWIAVYWKNPVFDPKKIIYMK